MRSGKNADLHYTKRSHLSASVTDGMEWHLEKSDDPPDRQPDKVYRLVVPVVCTSSDEDGNRFKQINAPYIEDRPVFNDSKKSSGRLNSVTRKMREEGSS